MTAKFLTLLPVRPVTVPAPGEQARFHAECVSYSLCGACNPVVLASQPAASAPVALGWMARRAGEIADQLGPGQAQPARAWIADRREQFRAAAQLDAGEPYALVLADGPVRYVLTAAPAHSAADACHHTAGSRR